MVTSSPVIDLPRKLCGKISATTLRSERLLSTLPSGHCIVSPPAFAVVGFIRNVVSSEFAPVLWLIFFSKPSRNGGLLA